MEQQISMLGHGGGTDAPGIDLAEVLEAALLADYNTWDKNGKIYATDLGVALGPEHAGCSRAFYEKCRNAPRKKPTVGNILMFKVGDLVHEYMTKLLTAALPQYGWRVVAVEERTQAFGVSGRLDMEIEHIETGARIVVDFKTKRGAAFGFLNEAKPENVLQVQFYEAVRNAIGGILLYIDREGQNFVRQFEVPRSDRRPEEAARRLTAIRDSLDPPDPLAPRLKRVVNKGPDSLYLNLPWQVEWCDLKDCPCRKNCGPVPSGICAKISKKGVVTMSEGAEQFAAQVMELLQRDYPDEDFYLEQA